MTGQHPQSSCPEHEYTIGRMTLRLAVHTLRGHFATAE
jgi:hypothetical protein